MDDEPNYARRLALILGGFMVGFTLIVVDTWTLIANPGYGQSLFVLILRYLPLVAGVAIMIGAFVLLRKPVEDDPGVAPDDVDNMDGA
ncbi:hypothetical protein AA0472_2629 [Acetobacter estunensis NRIC 0472]|uniref:Uncharacterized protein n=1 Tax=Acetobacter estunensis TaxID=104097 RepID=A0A967B5H7_9PROT|nr:hypothetical protein [Acetobacter estunensis]MBV1837433.1 hypothetical protein [Acetobacter estunensis]NHO52789.1 hypothetical protein [Acetobacter estunensis]GBQ28244.1 hypothetical protein AA0472_2629 [Acetobacter estunensis NRIC 0472]